MGKSTFHHFWSHSRNILGKSTSGLPLGKILLPPMPPKLRKCQGRCYFCFSWLSPSSESLHIVTKHKIFVNNLIPL